MTFRLFWIKYDNKPFSVENADLEKFDTLDDAINRGSVIIRENMCKTCGENADDLIESWRNHEYIFHQVKWHGLKLQLFKDNSYLSIFSNYFNEDDDDY